MSMKWPPWSRLSCLAPVHLAISSYLAISLSKSLKGWGTERVVETGPFGPVAHLGWGCVKLRDAYSSYYLVVANLLLLQLRSKYLLIAVTIPPGLGKNEQWGLCWSMLHWSTHTVQLFVCSLDALGANTEHSDSTSKIMYSFWHSTHVH